jgi:hypothetical protein
MRSISIEGQLKQLRDAEILRITSVLRSVVLSTGAPSRAQVSILLSLVDRWEMLAKNIPPASKLNWTSNMPDESKELYEQAKHFTEIIRKLYGYDEAVEAEHA